MSILVDASVWSLALRRDTEASAPEVQHLRDALLGLEIVVTTGLVLQELSRQAARMRWSATIACWAGDSSGTGAISAQWYAWSSPAAPVGAVRRASMHVLAGALLSFEDCCAAKESPVPTEAPEKNGADAEEPPVPASSRVAAALASVAAATLVVIQFRTTPFLGGVKPLLAVGWVGAWACWSAGAISNLIVGRTAASDQTSLEALMRGTQNMSWPHLRPTVAKPLRLAFAITAAIGAGAMLGILLWAVIGTLFGFPS